ncbi:hypothetical protein FRC01_000647 [Tulasnella sp. 417]|nr:hypothetical protein FRC01_000647 [Tulasnella sp. 417]
MPQGLVFDCSAKPDMYGPGGKDGSRALGLGSLKPEDAVADYSSLGPDEMKTLDNWLKFFQTVGVISIRPPNSASLDVKREFAVISDAETLVLGCRDTIKSAL